MDISLELKTKNGDFDLLGKENAMLQDEDIIILSDKGKIINNLLMGVGITKFLNGPVRINEIKSAVKNEFEKDGITLLSFEIVNGELNVRSYKK